jgi:hypothetical protein
MSSAGYTRLQTSLNSVLIYVCTYIFIVAAHSGAWFLDAGIVGSNSTWGMDVSLRISVLALSSVEA